MKGKYSEIIWSPLAVKQYENIKQYLLVKFTQKEVIKLNSLIDQFHKVVIKFPELYPKTKFRRDLFREVVAIYDNRQDFEPKLTK